MADRSMGDRIFQGVQGGAAIVGGTMIGKYDGRVARFTLKPAMIGLGGILLADALMRTSSAKAESAKPAAPPPPKSEPKQNEGSGALRVVSAGVGSTMVVSGIWAGFKGGAVMGEALAGGGSVGAKAIKVAAGLALSVSGTASSGMGFGLVAHGLSNSAKAEPAKPVEAPKPSVSPPPADNVGKAVDVGFTTMMTAQAAKLMANPAARAAAGVLSKAAVPLTIAAAAVGAYQGYQKDGVSGIALGAADGVTGGGASMALAYLNSGAEKKAAAAPAPVKAPAPQAAQGSSGSGDGGMKTYTTADGRSVQGTAAQIASWEGRKK